MGRRPKHDVSDMEDEEDNENDSYGSIIAVSDDEFPLNEDDDGSFVLPTPSSSSSSSYMSEGDQDDFDVSSDEDDEMQSEPSVAAIDAATVIDMLTATNPAQHIKKNVAKELQLQLLDILSEHTDKLQNFAGRDSYASIKCVALEPIDGKLSVYKTARSKPTEVALTPNASHSMQEVIAYVILNNFKLMAKTWRKPLGDETLYLQLKTALSVL